MSGPLARRRRTGSDTPLILKIRTPWFFKERTHQPFFIRDARLAGASNAFGRVPTAIADSGLLQSM